MIYKDRRTKEIWNVNVVWWKKRETKERKEQLHVHGINGNFRY